MEQRTARATSCSRALCTSRMLAFGRGWCGSWWTVVIGRAGGAVMPAGVPGGLVAGVWSERLCTGLHDLAKRRDVTRCPGAVVMGGCRPSERTSERVVLCGQRKCGAPAGRGHPQVGWLMLHQATGRYGKPRVDLWFCGARCLSYALTGDVDAYPEAEPLVAGQQLSEFAAQAIAELNRMAGTHLTVMTATPVGSMPRSSTCSPTSSARSMSRPARTGVSGVRSPRPSRS